MGDKKKCCGKWKKKGKYCSNCPLKPNSECKEKKESSKKKKK